MYKINTERFLLDSGERYCIVVNKETGIPLYYPTLYLTTQIRNSGHAIATVESRAVDISLFYRFLENEYIDIETQILKGIFLSGTDIDRLVMYLSMVSKFREGMNHKSGYVSKQTLRNRLNSLIHYISWLTEELLQYNSSMYKTNLSKMIKSIEKRRPRCQKNKNYEDSEAKALSHKALNKLMELIDPQSPINPFEPKVRNRNAMIIIILFELGIRGGELLNIKIGDINFQKKRIYIQRRADEISDPRLNQPLVKTLSRVLPLSDELACKLMDYIIHDRKNYNMSKTDFLFITYKSGPYQGQPLSISGYQKIISKLSGCDHLIKGLSGHKLRHTWNYNFSLLMDSVKAGEKEQEKIRERLMGWKDNSGTATKYNKRFIDEKTDEASIRLQKRLSNKRGSLGND
ncbi:TPA: site-specific integrase [Salmonella enterica subsp. enterica serovar Agoueve]|nr:site-specific integrase [Salmonella enterica subsp. enterica serovar Agoueve]EDT8874290.1 tyrosine-type recombinase/integrase [Salmonella enterica subsp. enterica]EIL6312228.1 site-specific integrase [Salmonella enterica]HAU7010855.1 tyrosine-type recombinase/integrase [Salmonella enterica subsp. enterica serovar Berta]HBM0013806.1 site-specific integrase [Salmonella enterica subsp. enterica serovar Agoueve]